jgi:hypothetical protein
MKIKWEETSKKLLSTYLPTRYSHVLYHVFCSFEQYMTLPNVNTETGLVVLAFKKFAIENFPGFSWINDTNIQITYFFIDKNKLSWLNIPF